MAFLLVSQADETGDDNGSEEIEQPDEQANDQNAAGHDQSILQNLLLGGPHDLLQLTSDLAEELLGLVPLGGEPVFLLDLCHVDDPPLLGLVVSGVLSAESAVLLHLETIGVILLVLHGVVVSLLALGASQSDIHAHDGTSLNIASLYHFVQ